MYVCMYDPKFRQTKRDSASDVQLVYIYIYILFQALRLTLENN